MVGYALKINTFRVWLNVPTIFIANITDSKPVQSAFLISSYLHTSHAPIYIAIFTLSYLSQNYTMGFLGNKTMGLSYS